LFASTWVGCGGELGVGGRGGGRGAVCAHPTVQGRGVADLGAELGDVAIDDPFEIAVELRATDPCRQFTDAGKPGRDDLCGGGGEVGRCVAGDCRTLTVEEVGEALGTANQVPGE